MSDNIAQLDLREYEDLAKSAVEWYESEKARLVKALKSQKKPFTKRPTGMDEYRQLATMDWGQVVAERGLKQARQLARRFFELQAKYGPPAEIPHPQLQDHHVSPHPIDPSRLGY